MTFIKITGNNDMSLSELTGDIDYHKVNVQEIMIWC